MKRFERVDLSPWLNHKLVYASLPPAEEEYGLENICILQENFSLRDEESIDGTEFRFADSNFDNVLCERQRVKAEAEAKKLHFIGFSHWGDTCENFTVVCGDGGEETVRVAVPDWSHGWDADIFTHFMFQYSAVRTAKIFLSSGAVKHPFYFHHCVCSLEKQERVREIVFPDNMLMHIVALTLEGEDGR